MLVLVLFSKRLWELIGLLSREEFKRIRKGKSYASLRKRKDLPTWDYITFRCQEIGLGTFLLPMAFPLPLLRPYPRLLFPLHKLLKPAVTLSIRIKSYLIIIIFPRTSIVLEISKIENNPLVKICPDAPFPIIPSFPILLNLVFQLKGISVGVTAKFIIE